MPSSASLLLLSLLSSQFDLQGRMASAVVRAQWCGGGLSGRGFVGETPVNLWCEDHYQAGTHREDWERQSQGVLET